MKIKLKSIVQWVCAVVILSVGCGPAHNIAGDWQSVFYLNQGGHIVLRITDARQHVLKASLYNVDDGPDADEHPISSISFRNSTLRFSSDYMNGSYGVAAFQGKLSADGNSIAGNWTQGYPVPIPQQFQRATRETAWKIDSSHHTQRFVSVDKDVQIDVLDWGGSGRPWCCSQGLAIQLTSLISSHRNSAQNIVYTALRDVASGAPALHFRTVKITLQTGLPMM